MPKLISPSGHSLELPAAPYWVGVAGDCGVQMQPGMGIADHHFSVLMERGNYLVVDGGSGLGTYLNGKQVTREALRDGDRLRFGQVELVFGEQVDDGEPTSEGGEPLPDDALDSEGGRRISDPSKLVSRDELLMPEKEPPRPAARETSEPSEENAEEASLESTAPQALSSPALQRLKSDPLKEKKKAQRRSFAIATTVTVMVSIGAVGAYLFMSPPQKGNGAVQANLGVRTQPSQATGPFVDAVQALRPWVKPTAVVCLDVGALADRELMGSLPRLKTWCYRYLKLELAEIDRVVGVGSSSTDYALGFVLARAVSEEQRQQTQGDLVFETLRGPHAARMVNANLIVVAPQALMESTKTAEAEAATAEALPPALASFLAQCDGGLGTFLEMGEEPAATLPFFASQGGVGLQRKAVRLVLDEPRLMVRAQYHRRDSADQYADRYGSAMRLGLQRMLPEKAALIESAAETLRSSVSEEGLAKIEWPFPKEFIGALVEMVGDGIGAEVPPPSKAVLEREAQRAAALFQTALRAGAALDGVETVEEALLALMRGVRATEGQWNGRVFQTRAYSARERQIMSGFLVLEEGLLRYEVDPLVREAEALPAAVSQASEGGLKRKYRHEATRLAEVFNQARAAGHQALETVQSVDEAVAVVARGEGDLSENPWLSSRDSPLSPEEEASLKYFLRLQDGELVVAESPVE